MNAPPWMKKSTGLSVGLLWGFLPGRKGVMTFRKRQFSLVAVLPFWTQDGLNVVASMALGPVYAVGYVQRCGGFA